MKAPRRHFLFCSARIRGLSLFLLAFYLASACTQTLHFILVPHYSGTDFAQLSHEPGNHPSQAAPISVATRSQAVNEEGTHTCALWSEAFTSKEFKSSRPFIEAPRLQAITPLANPSNILTFASEPLYRLAPKCSPPSFV